MGILMKNGINYSGSQLPSVTTGDSGKILTVNDNGIWAAQEVPTDEQVSEAVDEWLTAHPEATTTVQDNSLTWVKFNDVLKNMMFKLGITDSKSGALVSTSDAAEFPLKDLQSEITATQNLNGYEYPWVGGAGKNKINVADISGSTTSYYVQFPTNFVLTEGVTYTFSADITTNVEPFNFTVGCGSTSYQRDIQSYDTSSTATSGRLSITFTPTAEQLEGRPNMYIRAPRYGRSETFTYSVKNMQLEIGSTASAWTPYENICPISGMTEVNVTRTGKNLLPVTATSTRVEGVNFTIENGIVTAERVGTTTPYARLNYGHIKLPKGTYTVNGVTDGRANSYYIEILSGGYSGSRIIYYTNGDNTLTLTEETDVYFGLQIASLGLPNIGDKTEFKPMVRLATFTDAEYEPYEGDTFNTELGRTVYGGTLDLTTGELTVNTGLIASYNGETIGEPWMSDRDRYVAGTTPTIGAQVVYTKASETYQVDRTEVDAYFKNNTIWSDSGDVAVSYLVDAKTYIDNQ